MTTVLGHDFVMFPHPIVNQSVPNLEVGIPGQGEVVREHLPLHLIMAPLRVEMPYGIGDDRVRQGILDQHQVLVEVVIHVVL